MNKEIIYTADLQKAVAVGIGLTILFLILTLLRFLSGRWDEYRKKTGVNADRILIAAGILIISPLIVWFFLELKNNLL